MSAELKEKLWLNKDLCKSVPPSFDREFLEVCLTPSSWLDWTKLKLGQELPEPTKWNIKERDFNPKYIFRLTIIRNLSSKEVEQYFKDNY